MLTTLLFLMLSVPTAHAEDCKSGPDLDAATRSALDNAAQNYYQMAASGNAAGLQRASIPAVASNFSGIQSAIDEHKADFGDSGTVRNTYELDAPGNAPIAHAEFFCGIFNSPNRVAFAIPNLPPGRYGVVIMVAHGGKQAMMVSFVLQQAGNEWKMGGFYARVSSIAGHDAIWYLQQARAYKSKGEMHNAALYYQEAWELATPVPFMSTVALDKLGDEAQAAAPSDIPRPDQPLKLAAANGKAYNITRIFTVPTKDGLDLVVKFQVPDISNAAQTYQDNVAVMKALLAKYPEFREGFGNIVARAVAPSGQDYGTLLAMKDVK